MIIFGFGHRIVAKYGFVAKQQCCRCGNTVSREIQRHRLWFTLFFIPIFPYQTRYLIVCPICGAQEELSKEAFAELLGQHTQTASSEGAMESDPRYVGKTPTQIAFLKGMEEAKKRVSN